MTNLCAPFCDLRININYLKILNNRSNAKLVHRLVFSGKSLFMRFQIL